MAHFAYIGGSLGAWATGTTITAAKLWQLDQNQYAAINGDAGGTWAPSAVIAIGGSGVELASAPLVLSGTAALSVAGAATFTGNFTATGSINVIGNSSGDTLGVNAVTTFAQLVVCANNLVSSGNTTLGDSSGDTLTVAATATFQNDVTIGSSDADLFIVPATTAFTNDVTIGISSSSTLTVESSETHNGIETHNGDVSLESTVWVGGALTCNSTLAVAGNSTIGTTSANTVDLKSVVSSSTLEGRVIDGTVFYGDVSPTVGVFRKRFIFSGLTANRTLTISFNGAAVGDEVQIFCSSAANLDITTGTGYKGQTGSGSGFTRANLFWNGADWVFFGAS